MARISRKVVSCIMLGHASMCLSSSETQGQAMLLAEQVRENIKAGTYNNLLGTFESVAKQTPEAKESLIKALTKVMSDIDTQVIAKIVAGHQDTQTALDAAITKVEASAGRAQKQKSLANAADAALYGCIEDEKSKAVAVETAKAKVLKAETEKIAPCESQQSSSAFQAAPSSSTFECDFSAANCEQQLNNFELQLTEMMNGVKSDMELHKATYTAFKTDCDEKTAAAEQAVQAHESSVTAWKTQKTKCVASHESQILSVCLFGADLKTKCSDLDAFDKLVKEVDSSSADGSTGSVFSHSDRMQEWKTASMTTCILKQVVSGSKLDETALAACNSLNFESSMGKLDRHVDRYEAASSSASYTYTCDEEGIAFFNGKAWSSPEDAASVEYTLSDFKPIFRMDDDAPLCEADGSAPSCESETNVALKSAGASCKQNAPDPHWGRGSTDCWPVIDGETVWWRNPHGRHVSGPDGWAQVTFDGLKTVTKVNVKQTDRNWQRGDFELQVLGADGTWTTLKHYADAPLSSDTSLKLPRGVKTTALRFVGNGRTKYRVEEIEAFGCNAGSAPAPSPLGRGWGSRQLVTHRKGLDCRHVFDKPSNVWKGGCRATECRDLASCVAKCESCEGCAAFDFFNSEHEANTFGNGGIRCHMQIAKVASSNAVISVEAEPPAAHWNLFLVK